MKFIKTGINKLYLFVIMLILCCTGVGSAAFIHVTITDESVANSGGTPSHVVVAKLYNGSKWINYYSVEEALAKASSGNTVAIVPDSNAVIYGTYYEEDNEYKCVVPSGVTLAIPIADETLDATSANGNNDIAHHKDNETLNCTNFVNELTIKEDVKVTLNGSAKIVVYGQLSSGKGGGTYCGQPCGSVAALHMEAGSEIICKDTSSITAYGIITDARTDKATQTQGKITMNNGTTIKAPYIVRDFKGGSVTYAIYKKQTEIKQSPFYQFQILNIEPILEIFYGATFNGTANIYSNSQTNQQSVTIIGNSSSAFLQLTNSIHSKIVADYDEDTEICDVKIYGGLVLNSIKFSISIIGTVTLDTSKYVFPLSWRHRITLLKGEEQVNNAEFVVPQDFKCLPGSYFNIGAGCNVEFQASLAIYDYGNPNAADCFNDAGYTGELSKYCKAAYPESTKESQFVNNGNLTVKSVGGVIIAGEDGATLTVSQSNSVSSSEAQSYSGSSLLCSLQSLDGKNVILKGENGNELYAGPKYTACNSEWIFEEKISLSTNELIFNASESAALILTVYGLEDYTPEISVNNTNISYTLSEPTENETTRIRTYTITLTASAEVEDCTLTVNVGEKTATCLVTANASTVSVTGVTLNVTSQTLTITDDNPNPTFQLIATVLPIDATNQNVTWSSSNTEVATVIESGLVTAQRGGTATITVTTEDGEETAQCEITVRVPAQTISIYNDGAKVDEDTPLSLTMTNDVKNPTLTLTAKVEPDTTTETISWGSDDTDVATVEDGKVTAQGEGTAKITVTCGTATASCTISVIDNTCLIEGTLITMADGTKVPVENVKAGDELLVFNHETGKYDVAPVLFNDSEPLANYNVVYLEFEDGNKVGVVYEHGFFDKTTMQYEYITEDNYEQFIGHEFVNVGDGNNFSTTKLINAYVVTENVRVYSPVTKYHLNYFTEDMLSMPGGIKGLFNIFEMDEDLSYNEEAKAKDIETYGLFTYEDFKDYVSYEIYESFPAAYFKVSLGKGLMTWEDLLYYIERYAPLM